MIRPSILLVNIKQNKEPTGATIYAEEVFLMAQKSGLNIRLMVTKGSPMSGAEGVITIPYFKNKILRWCLYTFILPIHSWSFDVIHFSLDFPIVSTRLFYFFTKKKILTTVHDLGEFRTRRYSRSKDFLRKILVTMEIFACHKFIVVSNRTKTDLKELFNIPERDIFLVYNAPKVKFEEGLKSEAYPNLLYLTEKPYLLYVSSLNHPLKNHVGLIKAFEGIANRLVDYQLIFVGAKLFNHEHVLERIESSPFSNRIHYLGYLPQGEVHFLYKHAFAYVFPSKFEGFGRGVIEAWKYGLPLICSTGGSLEEIVGDGGILFNPDSNDEIEKAILAVVSSETLRGDLIEKGKKRLELFNEESVTKMLIDTYTKVVNG